MEKETKKQEGKHKCSNCGTSYGYLQLKTNTWVCRSCGNTDKLKFTKKKEK